jgi:hypothetical protein
MMEKKFPLAETCSIVLVFFWTLYVYRTWFTGSVSYGGDFYFPVFPGSLPRWQESLTAWNPLWGSGLGSYTLAQLGFYLYSVGLSTQLLSWGFPAYAVQNLLYILPILLIGSYGIHQLVRYSMGTAAYVWPLGVLIYLTNSYIFLIVSGGQLGIALAYAVMPLLFSRVMRFIHAYPFASLNAVLRESLIIALLTSLLILYDLRYTYIYGMLFIGCLIFHAYLHRLQFPSVRTIVMWTFVLPLMISVALHSFWVFPLLKNGISPISQAKSAYTGVGAPNFFSFADLAHSVSLLHPNWPENIFGKTYFMQPEFLLLPVLAFASLLFVGVGSVKIHQPAKESGLIIVFVLMAVAGSFLSKGTQDPIGSGYQWLFSNVPGFALFRDPTKFYVLTAMSYAVLIPYMLTKLLKSGFLMRSVLLQICVGIVIWGILHRDYLLSDTGRHLSPKNVPHDYTLLHDRISLEDAYFRTLWIPSIHRFGEMTPKHPAIPALEYLETGEIAEVIRYLNKPFAKARLQRLGVKYIIVPSDQHGELFLRDRIYDPALRKATIDAIAKIPWAVPLPSAGNIAVFRIDGSYGRFFYDQPGVYTEIPNRSQTPAEYHITLREEKYRGNVIFSEHYDQGWVMDAHGKRIIPTETFDHLMAFSVDPSVRDARIHFLPQDAMRTGISISVITLVAVVGVLAYLSFDKFHRPE